MLHSNLELLHHVNDECEFILEHTKGLDYERF